MGYSLMFAIVIFIGKKVLPYIVTAIVLIIVSLRQKREDQPPASLGLPYFREERSLLHFLSKKIDF